MATVDELAPRVLRKVGILAEGQPAEAEDALLAKEKLRAVHVLLRSEGVIQWTLNDIADYAEEPYVFMAAFLLGPDYDKPKPDFWSIGLSLLHGSTQLKSAGRVSAEYF